MSTGIRVTGWGAVSPAGWGVEALRQACAEGKPCPTSPLPHPRQSEPIQVRKVPPPATRPTFLSHSRLRRSSPISVYTTAAALEALGAESETVSNGDNKLGIIFTAMTGCVSYSRRFYDEVLKDPSTASPIVFPETVFNAPSSHLATYLKTNAINYTLIGDSGTFLQGLALAAEWLIENRVDKCLVVAAEELDWLVAGAQQHFDRQVTVSEGAGALLLERASSKPTGVQLDFVSQPILYTGANTRESAITGVHEWIRSTREYDVLFDSLTGAPRIDAAEKRCLQKWPGAHRSIKTLCGESFAAGSAWQCALAVDSIARGQYQRAAVCVAGCNEQAIGAGFSVGSD